MPDLHAQFAFLCAQAAAGQISRDERAALDEHLNHCEACRQAMREYEAVAEALTLHSDAEPEGMYERFRVKALAQGIQVPEHIKASDGFPSAYSWWKVVIATSFITAAIMVLVAVLIFPRRAVFHTANESIRTSTTGSTTRQPPHIDAAQENEVRNLQERERQLEGQLQEGERTFKTTQLDQAALKSKIAALTAEKDRAQTNESQTKMEIQRLEQDLQSAQASEAAAREESTRGLAQVVELRDQISKLGAQLSRERRLTAALEEARQLIENRNVRVITLGAVSQGKQERAFGRAFYVPGEKLVLFAYDLSDSNALAAHSFYVWGDKTGSGQSAEPLGRLTLEDENDDRWAIRIGSPDVFARINEFFITMESSQGNVKRPTGQPMLITSLTKPTHEK